MADLRYMKKAELLCYADELERKLIKAEAEVEEARNRQADAVRAEIRREERFDWTQTGLQMAADEMSWTLEDMELRDEIDFDLSYRLRNALQSVVDSFDVASIVE